MNVDFVDFIFKLDIDVNLVFDGCCGGIHNVVVIIGVLRRQVLDVNTAAKMEAAIVHKRRKEFFRFVVGKGCSIPIVFEVNEFVSAFNVLEFADLADFPFGSARIFLDAGLVIINRPANIT